MAKLSARGRIEILRVSKENDIVPKDDINTVIWERTTLAVMNDGKVLRKLDAKWKAGPYDGGKDRFYSWGWKIHGKLKEGKTAEDLLAIWLKQGYTLEAKSNG